MESKRDGTHWLSSDDNFAFYYDRRCMRKTWPRDTGSPEILALVHKAKLPSRRQPMGSEI